MAALLFKSLLSELQSNFIFYCRESRLGIQLGVHIHPYFSIHVNRPGSWLTSPSLINCS